VRGRCNGVLVRLPEGDTVALAFAPQLPRGGRSGLACWTTTANHPRSTL
jgi:hypothetical protein